MKRIEYAPNQKINSLTFLKEVEPHIKPNGRKERKAIFKCVCGEEVEFQIVNVKNGNTNSCGCQKIEQVRQRFTKHGLSEHPLNKVWRNIKGRCNNPKDKDFHYYGGRGIKICPDWKNDFKTFYDWAIANGYRQGLEIDRRNNDGNYEPDNCRWVTHKVNSQNRVRGIAI